MVAQQHSQARVFDGNVAGGLLHFQGGLDATALILLDFSLQALDIFLVASAGATLVVTNTDGGWVCRNLTLLQGRRVRVRAR